MFFCSPFNHNERNKKKCLCLTVKLKAIKFIAIIRRNLQVVCSPRTIISHLASQSHINLKTKAVNEFFSLFLSVISFVLVLKPFFVQKSYEFVWCREFISSCLHQSKLLFNICQQKKRQIETVNDARFTKQVLRWARSFISRSKCMRNFVARQKKNLAHLYDLWRFKASNSDFRAGYLHSSQQTIIFLFFISISSLLARYFMTLQ